MTDLQLTDLLIDELEIDPPADTASIAIVAINGSTMQLASNPGGTANQWVGSIVEVTSGASTGLRAIIVESNGAVITFASPFAGNTYPVVGNTVKLLGGPLAAARVYNGEPMSLKHAINAGVSNFVSVSCHSGEYEWKGFHGRTTNAAEAMKKSYLYEVIGEIVDNTATTAAAQKAMSLELPTLKEQLCYIIQNYRYDEAKRVTGEGSIKFVYGYMQRDEGPMTRAAILTFGMKVS